MDEENPLKDAFVCIKEALTARVIEKIPEEFIGAAILDPQQALAFYVENALTKIGKTRIEIIKDLASKYDLTESFSSFTPTSSDNSDLYVSVSTFEKNNFTIIFQI
jgi:hAT family C-terminal dimerisation region